MFGVQVNLQLGGYLGEFHPVILDLKGKHQFLWQCWLLSAPLPNACTPPSI